MSERSTPNPEPYGIAATTETAPSVAHWEDFIDIFYAPSQVYARRAGAGFGLPMLVVAVLLASLAFANTGVMQPIMDAEFSRASASAMAKNPQLTPEMMARGRSIGEAVARYGALVFVPVGIFLTGLALWLAGKVVGAVESYTAAVMVASYAFLPRVLEGVLSGLQGLLIDPSQLNGRYKLSLGVGRFLDPDTASPVMLALLGRVDVFTIWVTVLLAIGLSVTGRVSRGQAAIAGVIVWVLGALPALVGALRA